MCISLQTYSLSHVLSGNSIIDLYTNCNQTPILCAKFGKRTSIWTALALIIYPRDAGFGIHLKSDLNRAAEHCPRAQGAVLGNLGSVNTLFYTRNVELNPFCIRRRQV